MSEFDPGYKRLKIIFVLFLFLTGMYLLEWGCFVYYPSIQEIQPKYVIDIETMEWIEITPDYFNRSYAKEFGGKDFDFFGFMTFTLEEIPDWQKPIFASITIMIWAIAIYLTIDWIYAWIKALPFT